MLAEIAYRAKSAEGKGATLVLSRREGGPRSEKVWIHTDTSKPVGNADHLKVFKNEAAAEAWFGDHDTEGGAFAYSVQE